MVKPPGSSEPETLRMKYRPFSFLAALPLIALSAETGPGEAPTAGSYPESRILELHGDRKVRRDFAPGGRSELQLKDVRLMSELAERVGLHSSTLANSRQFWERFVHEMGHGNLDHLGLFRIYEEAGG